MSVQLSIPAKHPPQSPPPVTAQPRAPAAPLLRDGVTLSTSVPQETSFSLSGYQPSWVLSAARESRYIPMHNFLVRCQRVEVYT